MWELLKKKRIVVVAGVAFTAALLIYSYSLKQRERANEFEKVLLTLSSPLMGVLSDSNRYLRSFWDDYISIVSAGKENRALRESVRQLNVRVIEAQDAV